MTTRTAVYLEVGRKRTFACALDWPGWCRSGRDEALALEALADHWPRYAPVAARAGLTVAEQPFEVVARQPGGTTTDFGAPEMVAAADREPTGAAAATRLAALVAAAWAALDDIVADTPVELRNGPRGGGRDRDQMVAHVRGAEAAYARKIGVRHRPPANDDGAAIAAMRADILAVLGRPSDGADVGERGWPVRYAARRIAWHALDHAWEMQDRTA